MSFESTTPVKAWVSSINRPQTKNREIRALLKAMKEFNLEEGLIITNTYKAEENIKGKRIRYIPLREWYLE